MKTRRVTKAILFSGGMALLANPLWADGGSYGQDKAQHQAAQEKTGQYQDASHLNEQQIMQLQQALQERGVEPGSIDGKMGPQTRQALEKFQRDNNLEATGSLDERTAQELGLEFTQPERSSESSEAMGQEQPGESSQANPGAGESAPSSDQTR